MRRSEGVVMRMRGKNTKLSILCAAFLFLCMLACVVGVANAKTIYVPDEWNELPDGTTKVIGSGYVNGGKTHYITGTIGEPAGYRIFYLVDNYGNVLDSCRIDEEIPPPIQAEVKFKGVATTDEAYGQAVCYGSYYVKVRVEEILYDPENALEVGKEYEVCYGSNPKNIESGDRLEVYGKYYGSPAPLQYLDRVVAIGDEYYVKVIDQHVSTLVVYKTAVCTTGDDYFSTIQDAVNAANDGDTIIVCPGTYNENVYVDKSVEIRSYSQNPEDTVVKGLNFDDYVFYVTADDVKISGFTVAEAFFGIFLRSNNSRIENINFSNIIQEGIRLYYSSNNIIANNTINSIIYFGIYLKCSSNNTITDNTISNNGCGIYLYYSSCNNTIANNNISSNNYRGICLDNSNYNIIYLNNFINNTIQAISFNSENIWNSTEKITYRYKGNTYTNYLGNYWSDYTGLDSDGNGIGDTPYAIDGDSDNYPLMEPFENYITQPTPRDSDGDGIGDTPYIIDGDKDNYPLMEQWEIYFEENPSVGISTDKYEYAAGDTMLINITIANPREEGEEVKFLWQLNIYDYGITRTIVDNRTIILPSEYNKTYNLIWRLPSFSVNFNASFYVAMFNKTTSDKICEDYAYWRYSGKGKGMEEDVLHEYMEHRRG